MIKKPLACAILATFSMPMLAEANLKDKPTVILDGVSITSLADQNTEFGVNHSKTVSGITVSKEQLQQRATTLGDALAGELGVHSNHFGGGASAPIIRGQEGKRLKILQNGSEVVDMSGLSPDHAIAVDTTLAKQV